MKNTNRSKLLNTIKYFKPKLYKKMIFTGRLFEFLIRNLEKEINIMTYEMPFSKGFNTKAAGKTTGCCCASCQSCNHAFK